MANEGGIKKLDYLGDPRGENKQFFPDKNYGPTYEEAVKFLMKERSGGLSFNESDANALVISFGVGPILKLSELVQRGASGTAQAFRDMGSFIQDPSGATLSGVKSLINTAVKGWNYVNPINSIDAKVDADGNYFPKGDAGPADIDAGNNSKGIDSLLSETDQDVLKTLSPEDRAQYMKDIASGKKIDVPFDTEQKDKGYTEINPATGEKWTDEEIAAEDRLNVINAANAQLDALPGISIGDNKIMSQFDSNGDRKLSARESETMRGGGIFPNMGANRQEYGGGNYGPSSGFDTMSNYFWPMALNDAKKRGEDVSSPEGIKAVFDQAFPGGDHNKFKYSSGPGALAFFGQDSLGIDGKPLKSSPNASVTDAEGNIVDSIDWYTYDPITGEGLFTEEGIVKFKAANPGVTPPVGVKRSSASRKEGEPDLSDPSENEEDDGLNPDGSRKLPPIPRPDKDGKCPAGYNGIDTNGDGFIDTCVSEQSQIPGAPDTQNAGPGGRVRVGGENDSLEVAAEKSSKQVFNDPTNFMKYAPSALQMMDPRYYGIKSFVPRGEQKDFNTQYRSLPGQQYANYNVVKDREKPSFAEGGLMSLAGGGSTSYPRMNGQIAGPGTEKSDDIPAMLSDGEFVVNAAAVRGIGNLMGKKKPKGKMNQRREGARTMYALQQAGEKAARMS